MNIDYDSWQDVFVIIPRVTVSKRWVWGRCFRRKVWVYTGFVDEPEYQYGDLFDVLKWS